MAVKVQIPAPLRSLTAGAAEVEVEASTLQGLLDALETRFKGVKSRLCDEEGRLRSYVRVFVNGEDARTLGDASAPLRSGDTVSIVPAIAGGQDDGGNTGA
ncbi:MAG TPA: MoaD family protein [Vicinamibacteria bacterium]|nr:MoaD family protein [Vicinamibacteria bacterium]